MRSRDGIFALPSASITLETKLGLRSDKAAICIKESSGYFQSVIDEIRGFLDVSKELSYEYVRDKYGYIWFILSSNIETLTAAIDAMMDSVDEKGFGMNILAAVFRFVNGKRVYLIYRFKDKRFYPFVPTRSDRNLDEEMRIYSIIKKELPMIDDMEKWYPIWDLPL